MQEQSDLVKKWSATGLLRDVKPHYIQRAAERLETAMGRRNRAQDLAALDKELAVMTREGVFSSKVT